MIKIQEQHISRQLQIRGALTNRTMPLKNHSRYSFGGVKGGVSDDAAKVQVDSIVGADTASSEQHDHAADEFAENSEDSGGIFSCISDWLRRILRILKIIWLLLKACVSFPIQCVINWLKCVFDCGTECTADCFQYIRSALQFIWLLLKAILKFLVQRIIRALKWLDRKIILSLDE